jgi:hypothetical protein
VEEKKGDTRKDSERSNRKNYERDMEGEKVGTK